MKSVAVLTTVIFYLYIFIYSARFCEGEVLKMSLFQRTDRKDARLFYSNKVLLPLVLSIFCWVCGFFIFLFFPSKLQQKKKKVIAI